MIAITAFIFGGCSENINNPSTGNSDLQSNGQMMKTGVINAVPTTGDGGPLFIDAGVVPCGTPDVVDFWAGQSKDAGSVTVYNDNTNLYVTVYSEFGFQNKDENLKMWLGSDLTTLPRSPGSGAPINGQFPYKVTLAPGVTTYTFTILLDDLQLINACGDLLYVVVHGDVYNNDGNGGTETNTAYSGDNEGDGSRWWYYSNYVIQCCDTPPVFDRCETAFAKGQYVFASSRKANPENLGSLNLSRSRWGWAIFFSGDSKSYDIYAGAGLNNTANGTLVGTLTVEKSNDNYTVTYTMVAGKTMEELHIYIDDVAPTTHAPGQYGYTQYFDPMAGSYSATFTVTDAAGDGVWIIAHSVVCWQE